MNNPLHRQAWQYLQMLDKGKFHSYSNAIAIAVVDYFDRYYKAEADPLFTDKEREKQLADRIIYIVSQRLNTAAPMQIISGKKITDGTDKSGRFGEIDLDFIGNE